MSMTENINDVPPKELSGSSASSSTIDHADDAHVSIFYCIPENYYKNFFLLIITITKPIKKYIFLM